MKIFLAVSVLIEKHEEAVQIRKNKKNTKHFYEYKKQVQSLSSA